MADKGTYRTWKCEIQTKDLIGAIATFETVGYPLTVDFNIVKSITGQMNYSQISIYNLTSSLRRAVEVDEFSNINRLSLTRAGDTTMNQAFREVRFYVSSASQDPKNLPLIFSGNIIEAFSRKNETDIVLEMTVGDGAYGYANSFLNISMDRPTTAFELANNIAGSIKNVKKGTISPNLATVVFPEGYVSNDNAMSELCTVAGGDPQRVGTGADVFVDNQTVHALGRDEVFARQEILDDNQILDTPRATNETIDLTILFNPFVRLGGTVRLNSQYNTFINGVYKICHITHSGTVSGGVESKATTSIQVWRQGLLKDVIGFV